MGRRDVDRTPKPCTHVRVSHVHGTHLAYDKDECRCVPCAAANSRQGKRERFLRATGRPSYIDAAPAREHVRMLLATLTVGQIERRSGVNRTSIKTLLGEHPGMPMSRRIMRRTAARLLAVRPDRVGTEGGGLVDATGTVRRLQALVSLGWDGKYLNGRLNTGSATSWKLLTGKQTTVTVGMRDRVRDLYDELSLTPRPPSGKTTRAQNMARARGWASALAWDEDTIDDPSAVPNCGPALPPNGGRPGIDLDELEHLLSCGESLHQAAAQMGATPVAITAAAYRAGRTELGRAYTALIPRAWARAS